MDLVLNPTEPDGECRFQAGFFLFEINGKAATGLCEHLYLFEGSSFRRVSFLTSGIYSPGNPSISFQQDLGVYKLVPG